MSVHDYYECVCMGAHTRHHVQVEVRGQLCTVGLFPAFMWVPGTEFRWPGMCGNSQRAFSIENRNELSTSGMFGSVWSSLM